MKPLHYYLLGNASWFFSWGVQIVVFAWLVTMVLHESPSMVGVAQMTLLIPSTLLMLIGGSLSDHFGGQRVAVIGHCAAAVAPLILMITILSDSFTYGSILLYAIVMGSAHAFATPARDGLLNQVAGGKIQRRVKQASIAQFGVQMLGFMVASQADRIGAAVILGLQTASLLGGAWFLSRVELPPTPKVSGEGISTRGLFREMATSLAVGYQTVIHSPPMRVVFIQNCAIGIFFMGSYIVTIPLLVREVYGGSSSELAWLTTGNSLGLVLTVIALLRFGDLQRPGRALLVGHILGAFSLAGAGLGLGFSSVVVCLFCWGASGGIAMTMARTIMQEQAPEEQRGRMMAFFYFAFMGSGPIGTLLCGFMVDLVGSENALLLSSTAMLTVITVIAFKSDLWRLGSKGRTTLDRPRSTP